MAGPTTRPIGQESTCRVVGIMTRVRTVQLRDRGSILGEGKRLFLYHETYKPALGPPTFIFNAYRRRFRWAQSGQHDAHHRFLSSTEVNNESS